MIGLEARIFYCFMIVGGRKSHRYKCEMSHERAINKPYTNPDSVGRGGCHEHSMKQKQGIEDNLIYRCDADVWVKDIIFHEPKRFAEFGSLFLRITTSFVKLL